MGYIVIIPFILAFSIVGYLVGFIGKGLLILMSRKLCAAYVTVWTIVVIIAWFHPLPVVLIPGTKQNILGAPGVFWSLAAIVIYSIAKLIYSFAFELFSNHSNQKKIVPGNYVYIESELGICWTTGFFTPSGRWIPESDHASPGDAVDRVNFLNGATHLGEKQPA